MEPDDPTLFVGLDDTKVRGLVLGNRDRRHRDASVIGHVLLDHLAGVHAVDVVSAEDAHDVGLLIVDQVEVLVDRVG